MASLKLIRFTILAVATLYIGIVMLGLKVGMNMGSAPPCLMMGHRSQVCPMTAADHISSWERTLLAVPSKEAAFLAVLLVVFLFDGGDLFWVNSRRHAHCHGNRDGPDLQHHIVIRLISAGIIQPTVYG